VDPALQVEWSIVKRYFAITASIIPDIDGENEKEKEWQGTELESRDGNIDPLHHALLFLREVLGSMDEDYIRRMGNVLHGMGFDGPSAVHLLALDDVAELERAGLKRMHARALRQFIGKTKAEV